MRTISLGVLLLTTACRFLFLQMALIPSQNVVGFVSGRVSRVRQQTGVGWKPQQAVQIFKETAAAAAAADDEDSFVLKKVRPILRIKTGSEVKVVNAFGLWCFTATLLTFPIWMAAMMFFQGINRSFGKFDPNRAIFDKTGKIWSKVWLTLTQSYPVITGNLEAIKETSNAGPCLYVANHASWLDIPVLCTVLDPVFKFIAKGELARVPCIGRQLTGGNHILIDRDDRRSQIRTYKEGITWLKKGVPIMAFPEGMRSRDGRLMSFKGGLFSMAVKTKVPIVPITICNTHAVMPATAILPVQPGGKKLQVHIHSPIDTTNKTESQLEELVRAALLSKLPKDQLPLPLPPSSIVESSEPIVLTVDPLQKQHHAEVTVANGDHVSAPSHDQQQGGVIKSADALKTPPL